MACKCSDPPNIRYEILSYDEFLTQCSENNINELIDDTLYMCTYNKKQIIDGKITIALLGETIIGRTGIEIDDPYPIFSGTDILPEHQQQKICKPLIKHMLLDFNNWEQNSVIMHVVSKMVSALFCYVKAALDLDYTVNLYDYFKNKVGDQITDVEKDHFSINDQLTHIKKYKNLHGLSVDFYFLNQQVQ